MTVIAGIIVGKCIYLGTDSQVTWGSNYSRPIEGGKFIPLPTDDLLICYSGDFRYSEILKSVFNDPKNAHCLHVEDKSDLQDLMDLYSEELNRMAGTPKANQLPEHDFGFLVASAFSNTLWLVDGDFSIIGFSDYVACGSGYMLAGASLLTMDKLGVSGIKALKIALEVACIRDPNCGGEVVIKKLRLKTNPS